MKLKSTLITKLPYWVSLIIVIFIFFNSKNIKKWDRENNNVISWDVISYYAYLPATFIYNDYTLDFMDNYKGPHKFVFWPEKSPSGKKVILTSMGMSILYSPFFFVGHMYAKVFGYDAGGFSPPYHLALTISTIFYFAVGLFFLSKLLLKFFNPYISAWTIILVTIGTNIYFYVNHIQAMSHPYSFALIIMFIWYTIKWYETPKLKYTIFLGLLIGIISLIRPTNIIVALFFIFWDIKNIPDVKSRLLLFIRQYKTILILVFCCFIVWLPQLLYWKSQTGSFLYYSYGEENKFFFNHPRILKGIFSYRNGWLVYSPVMIFSVLGMLVLWKKFKEAQVSIILTFLVFIYVIYSWWCWWYGGSFGSRAMIDLYGLLALPTAAFFSYISEKKRIIKGSFIFLSFVLLIAGIHHTAKFRHQSFHWDSMTKEAFWDSYFKTYPSNTLDQKLKQPDYEKARQGIDAYVIKQNL